MKVKNKRITPSDFGVRVKFTFGPNGPTNLRWNLSTQSATDASYLPLKDQC